MGFHPLCEKRLYYHLFFNDLCNQFLLMKDFCVNQILEGEW